MDKANNGFTQEQLVIYKLGQIESQLAALLVKLTDNNIQTNKDILDLGGTVRDNQVRLDKLERQVNYASARFWGAAAVISGIIAFGKDIILKWLTSFSIH